MGLVRALGYCPVRYSARQGRYQTGHGGYPKPWQGVPRGGHGGGAPGRCPQPRMSMRGAGAAGVRWMRFGAPMHGGPGLGAPVSRVPSVFAAAPFRARQAAPLQGAAIGTSGGGGGSTTRNPLARAPQRRARFRPGVMLRGARGRFSLLASRFSLLETKTAPPERSAVQWPERELNPRHRDFQSRALPTELPGRTGAESSIRWGPGEDAVPG